MTLSRRGLLGVFASALAAPAIVKVESLMRLPKPEIIRAPAISMRMLDEYAIGDDNLVSRLDVLYGKMHVRPEWTISLDEYSERILGPMVDKLAAQWQKSIADVIMNGNAGESGVFGLLGSTSPLE